MGVVGSKSILRILAILRGVYGVMGPPTVVLKCNLYSCNKLNHLKGHSSVNMSLFCVKYLAWSSYKLCPSHPSPEMINPIKVLIL